MGTLAAGCSKDFIAPDPENAPYVGTYDLVSLTFKGEEPLAPPRISGVLVLAADTYTLTVQILPDSAVSDSGTYTVSGDTWTQISSIYLLRSSGTVKLAHDTLTLHVVTPTADAVNVWKRRAASGQ
jgi:hypothetical protein